MGSGAAPLSFVDENEAVNHILQVVRRDEIAVGCGGPGADWQRSS